MRKHLFYLAYVALILSGIKECPAAFCQPELRGPQPTNLINPANPTSTSTPTVMTNQGDSNNTGVSSAPGADAMMTQDLLMVSPDKSGQPPKPLQDFIGQTLKLNVDRTDITFIGLRGLEITVTNDTKRPLLIDGDNAKVVVGATTYTCVSLAVLQKKIMPDGSTGKAVRQVFTQVVPAAVTVGAAPTVADYHTIKKPIRARYGRDEKRRLTEASRFGKRILWPHQKTQGIIYFQTANILAGAKVQIPVNTLFDAPDNALLTN